MRKWFLCLFVALLIAPSAMGQTAGPNTLSEYAITRHVNVCRFMDGSEICDHVAPLTASDLAQVCRSPQTSTLLRSLLVPGVATDRISMTFVRHADNTLKVFVANGYGNPVEGAMPGDIFNIVTMALSRPLNPEQDPQYYRCVPRR